MCLFAVRPSALAAIGTLVCSQRHVFPFAVMLELVPSIHVLRRGWRVLFVTMRSPGRPVQDVDGRHGGDHDGSFAESQRRRGSLFAFADARLRFKGASRKTDGGCHDQDQARLHRPAVLLRSRASVGSPTRPKPA